VKLPPFDDDVWELYADEGLEQANRPVEADAGEAGGLQRRWADRAARYNVLPLDDPVRTNELRPLPAGPS